MGSISVLFFLISSIASSTAAVGIVETSKVTSEIPGVGAIWTGEIPTSISIPSDEQSVKLEFTIKGLLPIKVLADKANGVNVEFSVWSDSGVKLGSSTIYSFSWNPVGPNTIVSLYLFDNPALIGTHTLLINTEYTTSTTGLLSRYIKDDRQLKLKISKEIAKPIPTASPKSTDTSSTPTASPKSTDTPVGNPGTGKSGSEKISVTCRKGKVVKKISSINPICPSGYASDTGIGTNLKSSFATFLLQGKSTLRSIDPTVPLGDGFVYSMKVCNGNKSEASKFTSARWSALGVNGARFRPSGISGYSAIEPVYPFDDSAFTVLPGECFSGNLIFITKQVIKEIRYELPKEVTGKLEILRFNLG